MILVLKLCYWMMILAIGIAALLLVALFVAVVVKGLRHEDHRIDPDPDRLVDDQEGTEEGEGGGRMICCCSLAGTQACRTCSNGSGYFVTNTGGSLTSPSVSWFSTEPKDLVEVVRCKDCKYNYANMIPDGKGCQQNVYIEADDNFFCADGERREE